MLLIALCVSACEGSGEATGNVIEDAVSQPIQVIPVEKEVVGATVPIGGTVSAHKTVVLTAQLPGRIKFLAGDEGDAFTGKSVLVKLDDAALQAKLQAAQAQEASAGSALRNAGVQLDREVASPGVASNTPGGMGMPSMADQIVFNPMQSMMGMRQPGVERQSDLHARQSQVEQAHASLLQARSQIDEIQANLRDTYGIAPFDGVIVKSQVEIGDTVQPGQPLLEYADTSVLKIDVDVPLSLSSELHKDQPIDVKSERAETPFTASVARIYPVADATRHTVRVELAVPPDAPTSPGMYVEVLVPDPDAQTEPAITVPETAIVQRGGLSLLFVVNQQGQAVLRLVRLGERVDDKIEILSGLSGDERIVATPPPGLQSNDNVI